VVSSCVMARCRALASESTVSIAAGGTPSGTGGPLSECNKLLRLDERPLGGLFLQIKQSFNLNQVKFLD
jgi:hypothetical protein